MRNHMPYGITQCYLPPGSGDFPAGKVTRGTAFPYLKLKGSAVFGVPPQCDHWLHLTCHFVATLQINCMPAVAITDSNCTSNCTSIHELGYPHLLLLI